MPPRKSVDVEHDYSLLPKMSATAGAPWHLCSASGVVLAMSPTMDAATTTARAMWGRLRVVPVMRGLDLFVGQELRGRVVPGRAGR